MGLVVVAALACLSATACTTVRQTELDQTARAQLLLSRAADRAASKIHPAVPKGSAIYLDTHNFIHDAAYRTRYAISRIRTQLLTEGYRLVDTEAKADTIAEVSSGALSINRSNTLFGFPSFPLPIPFTNDIKTPEIALYGSTKNTGVAKFSIVFYGADGGYLHDAVGPVYGFSYYDRSSILGIGWNNQNLLPPGMKTKRP